MRRYKVYLKNETEPFVVNADDVSLTSAEGDGRASGAILNFWKAVEGETDVTVAAVSFDEFRYAVSE